MMDDSVGFTSWLKMTAPAIFRMTHLKCNRKTWCILFCLEITSAFSSDSCKFLQQSDEFNLASCNRSLETNQSLFNAIVSKCNANYEFDTDSSPQIIDAVILHRQPHVTQIISKEHVNVYKAQLFLEYH